MTLSPRRILVVDDNRDLAESVSLLLQLDGHALEVAYDGPTALALAATFRPDVALVDLGLPGMDGYETVARLRGQLPHVRIVIVTGHDREPRRSACLDAYLVKPVFHGDLKRVLASLPA